MITPCFYNATHTVTVKPRRKHAFLQGIRIKVEMLVFLITWISLQALQTQIVIGAPSSKTESHVLVAERFMIQVEPDGAIRVIYDDDEYFVTSSYSYPGEKIGYHRIGTVGQKSDELWKPQIQSSEEGSVTLSAESEFYTLRRTITLVDHRVEIRDTLTNKKDEDIGVFVEHTLSPAGEVKEIRLCGGPDPSANSAENPTIFINCRQSSLAAIAQDNISRVQFSATSDDHSAAFGLRHLALRPSASVTLEWAIYPFDGDADYFTFINRVRDDLDVNQTILGPGGWLDVTREPFWSALDDPEQLRKVLERNKLKVVLLAPWLDYENIHCQTKQFVPRDQYMPLMKKAIRLLHQIDPEVNVLACLEAPFVGLPEELARDLYQAVPEPKKQGYFDMTEQMFDVFKEHPLSWMQWRDSLVYNREGLTKFELYYREGLPLVALTARPIVGNGQHAFLMDQARFVLDEVGFDGYYIDSFTGAQNWYYGYSYDRWDETTVDIDSSTGRIVGRYTDLALAGTESRRRVIQYGIDKGKLVLVNGHPITRDTQSLGQMAFNESEWSFEPLEWLDEKPPFDQRPCEAHLSTPLALGFRPSRHADDGQKNYSQILMKGAITYLRHGVLYFHYAADIPENGPGSGEFGPFNHMFPITPVRLGEGFVEGRERIVTCVSRTFEWPHKKPPKVLVFDITGRQKEHSIQSVHNDNGWQVSIKLDDWQNIAVIE